MFARSVTASVVDYAVGGGLTCARSVAASANLLKMKKNTQWFSGVPNVVKANTNVRFYDDQDDMSTPLFSEPVVAHYHI